jgi:3-oxoadipate enol-lactonase
MTQTTFIQIGAARVAYTVTGDGPGVLLVHGAGASKETNWGFLTERLRNRYTVVALDLSGSGETTDDGGSLELDTLVQQVHAVAQAAGQLSYHLVGYSMGSVVASATAVNHPGVTKSLTLIAPWAENSLRMKYEFDLWLRLFDQDKESWVRLAILTGTGPETFAKLGTDALEGMVEGFLQITPDGVARQANLITRMNVQALLPRILAPTLVIGLTHDQQVLVEHAQEVHRLIPGAQYTEIASGHLAPWQHPDKVFSLIDTFLATQGAQP